MLRSKNLSQKKFLRFYQMCRFQRLRAEEMKFEIISFIKLDLKHDYNSTRHSLTNNTYSKTASKIKLTY